MSTLYPDTNFRFTADRGTFVGIVCGISAGALWGLVFLAPELAKAFSPLQLTIGRYSWYGLISAVLIAPRWRSLINTISARHWISLMWISLIGNLLYYILLSFAVQNGGIAMTSLVIGFIPVVVTIIGSRDTNAVSLRKLSPSLILCVAASICIGWQALAGPDVASGKKLLGLLCAIGALVAWTVYAVGNARCLTQLKHISTQDWNLLTGVVTGAQSIALIPIAILFNNTSHRIDEWLQFAGVSAGVAVLASIVGNSLWNRMSRLLPLTLVGQMILFETFFALAYGLIWEHRLPTTLEVAALVFVVMSVLLCISAHSSHTPLKTESARNKRTSQASLLLKQDRLVKQD